MLCEKIHPINQPHLDEIFFDILVITEGSFSAVDEAGAAIQGRSRGSALCRRSGRTFANLRIDVGSRVF